jgi:hypothetical protein
MQDQGGGYVQFDFVEGSLLIITPVPFVILFGQFKKGFGMMGETLDESTVEVRKTKEGLYFPLHCGSWPLCHPCDFDQIHVNLTLQDDKSKIFDHSLLKITLIVMKVQLVLTKSFENNSCDSPMFHDGFHVDEDIIEVDADNTFHNQILENVVHHHLEGRWGVGESKKHHQWFIEATIFSKCCLPLITLLHAYIVVPPSDVEFGEELCTAQLINKLRN